MNARAAEISTSPDTFFADQFNNPDAASGYAPLAEEIVGQTINAAQGNRSLACDILPSGSEQFVFEGRSFAG